MKWEKLMTHWSHDYTYDRSNLVVYRALTVPLYADATWPLPQSGASAKTYWNIASDVKKRIA